MAVWISVTTEALDNTDARQRQPQDSVRRPQRGIQVKEDTYAMIRVITATGEDVPFLDGGSADVQDGIGRSARYSNFLLQSVTEQRAEKSQIVETFGEDYIYFFGERPRFLEVTGILINSQDFNWKNEFWENYETKFRGTRLVEMNARMYFYYDDVVVEGFMMGAQATYASEQPHMLPIQFRIFVCNYAQLSTVGSVYFRDTYAYAGDMTFGDTEEAGVTTGLVPPTKEARQQAASTASRLGADGGLNSFLAQASKLSNSADFSIQNTLENIRNAFYGSNLVVPEGIGQTLYQAPLVNQASFPAPPTNRPIHEMDDEYVNRTAPAATYDNDELERVRKEQKLRSPEELERRAKAELEKLGIDTSRRETSYALLGRGAFAATQTMASFALVQAGGNLP